MMTETIAVEDSMVVAALRALARLEARDEARERVEALLVAAGRPGLWAAERAILRTMAAEIRGSL